MLVVMRSAKKDLEMKGPMTVEKLLRKLDFNRESVLVIHDGELVPGDKVLPDDAKVEIRSVISGGASTSGGANISGDA